MRHFLFEFITGGGLSDQDLPESLLNEGELMVLTLIDELIQAGHKNISLSKDKRFNFANDKVHMHDITKQNMHEVLSGLVKKSDVAWLIAPETDYCLYSLAKLFIESGNLFIGSNLEAIKLTTSKLSTYKFLMANNINTITTKSIKETVPDSLSGWIIKPDDGVGGEGCLFIDNKHQLTKLIREHRNSNMVVQPFLPGKPMSISLLVYNGDVRLLACNKQYIDIDANAVNLTAIGVNECLSYKSEMIDLAKNIVRKMPGLAGYIGIDVIESNETLYVVDINPRFTTAYAGLPTSLGVNIATKVMDTFTHKQLPEIDLSRAAPVKINII